MRSLCKLQMLFQRCAPHIIFCIFDLVLYIYLKCKLKAKPFVPKLLRHKCNETSTDCSSFIYHYIPEIKKVLPEVKPFFDSDPWSRPESNWDQKFRKLLFYPLNYETNILSVQSYQISWVMPISIQLAYSFFKPSG